VKRSHCLRDRDSDQRTVSSVKETDTRTCNVLPRHLGGLSWIIVTRAPGDESARVESSRVKSRRDETRRDEMRRNQTRREETGRDGTRDHSLRLGRVSIISSMLIDEFYSASFSPLPAVSPTSECLRGP
jgi:hypothetical protein